MGRGQASGACVGEPLAQLDLRDGPHGVTLRVRLQPRASREEVVGVRDGVLIARVTAPPVDGAANHALARLLARTFGCAPSAVELLRGERGRDKLVTIQGSSARQLLERLASRSGA
jgi:uncharacterized protein (TIGR00251 family)